MAEIAPEKVVPLQVAEPASVARVPAQPVEESESTKAPGRGKRMVKTVGRWLHIGKKDTPAESVRQQ